MMDSLFGTWEWYVAGPLIGLFVPLLLLVGNKLFGISSSFEHVCDAVLPGSKKNVVNYDKAKNSWKFYFVIGIAIGGFVASYFLSKEPVNFLPENYYSLPGLIQLFIGGILVGFGTRYANGCTSGHAITGFSLLNIGSIKSTIAFFAGGLIFTYLIVNVF
jgi:uncharacterized membrane protein YedE/YeeE